MTKSPPPTLPPNDATADQAQRSAKTQRRDLLFQLLDDLKAKGERITADKLARLASMGKQTVLPYYNEWRFLTATQAQAAGALPADLVNVLKRHLAQWQYDLAADQRAFQEQANQEIDALQQVIQQQTDDHQRLQQALQEKTDEAKQLAAALQAEAAKQQGALTEIATLQAQLHHAQDNVREYQAQLTSYKQEQAAALAQQETQLNRQLDHWLTVLDDEKQQKQRLAKQVDALTAERQTLMTEQHTLQQQRQQLTQAQAATRTERDTLQDRLTRLRPALDVLNQLQLLLDIDASLDSSSNDQGRILKKVKALLASAQTTEQLHSQLQDRQQRLDELTGQLAQAHDQLATLKNLELALEQQRGYSAALEKVLQPVAQTTQSTTS